MKLTTQAMLISAALYEKVLEVTKGSGKLIQEYFDDEKNIEHLSLMLYDLLPLSFKFTIRHEKFHKGLKLIINNLRENVEVKEQLPVATVVIKKEIKKPVSRKPRAKKVKVTQE